MGYLTIKNYKKLEKLIKNCDIYENKTEYTIQRDILVFDEDVWKSITVNLWIERVSDEDGDYIILSKMGSGDEAVTLLSRHDVYDINEVVRIINSITELQIMNEYGNDVVWN